MNHEIKRSSQEGRSGAYRWLAMMIVVVLACGCGKSNRSPRIESAASEHLFDKLPVSPGYSFSENLQRADVWVEKLELNPNLYGNRRYLTRGWSVPSAATDSEVKRTDLLWARRKEAEIVFVLREVADRTLVFWAGPFEIPGVEDYSLSLKWNGRVIREGDLGRGKIKCSVPKAVQVQGINRLSLVVSSAGRPILTIPESEDVRLLSANVSALRLEINDKEAEARAQSALAMLPEGVALLAEGPMQGKVIKQVSGSQLWYHLKVPSDAHLTTQVAYVDREEGGAESARFSVSAIPRGGDKRIVLEAEVSFGDSVELSGSLEELSGQVCRFEFEVHAVSDNPEPVLGWWGQPQLAAAGVESHDDQVPDQLQVARRKLRHSPVILFLLDAANPSYISSYGGRAGLTPNLDRLAAEGVRFDHAVSQAAYTISSVPSTLTSRYAWEHGAWQESTRLTDALPTWPEAFRAAGYQTHAIFCSPNGSGLFGNARGFDTIANVFRDVQPEKQLPQADDVVPVLERVLAQRKRDKPVLLWVHIIEPHEPYKPPSPWGGSLCDPEYEGRLTGTADDLWAIRRWEVDPTDEEIRHIENEYEENLAYVDHVLGKLRAKLEQAGIFEDALIGVFSDHGEGFLAHSNGILAGMGHGSTVYDEMTRIPMILRLPTGMAAKGAVSPGLVANIDLFPTIADLVEVAALPGHHGRSFARQLFEPNAPGREFALSHSASWHAERFLPTFAMWSDGLKYIYSSGNADELYDLRSDPGETHNLAGEDPIMAGYLRQSMRKRLGLDMDMGLMSSSAKTEIDEEALKQMQALGYAR